tara:strand:+ start:398 stop:1093 length:696 start_codon:yes stop_codon:yes gene_type:complete
MKNGYEVVDNFLTEEEHKNYVTICKDVYKKALENPNNEYYSWYDEGHLNKINGACNFVKEFLELASNPILVNRAKKILKTENNLDVFISKFFPMKPNGGVSTFMHQDNYYFKGNPNEMVSCAIYLEDTNKENGCLRIAKDSHLDGIVEHTSPSKHEPQINWIDESKLSKYEIVDFELPAPYAVFFNINSIHGCYKNNSNNTRFSLAWEYVESDNKNLQMVDHISFDRNQTL